MKKKPHVIPKNYLERVPARPEGLQWTVDENGNVTLMVENTGWANRIAQKVFGRPKFSQIHLDATGSFLWPLLDGEMDITQLGKLVDEKFGEEAHPLYERLARYFEILDSYHFITWVKK